MLRPVSPEHPDDETFPGLLIVRPEGRLFFVNAPQVGEAVRDGLARDAEPLRPRALAGDEGDGGAGHAEGPGEEADERVVRRALDGRRGDADLQDRLAAPLGDALDPGRAAAGGEAHGELDAAGRLAPREGRREGRHPTRESR